jgi:plasmid stability protein
MTSLTVRNVPEDAKRRFRQVAAAYGRSMEEHLRQMIIEADFGDASQSGAHLAEAGKTFRHKPVEENLVKKNIVQKLLNLADGTSDNFLDPRKYEDIRFMTAKDALTELRRLANGVGFDVPRTMNTDLDAPQF